MQLQHNELQQQMNLSENVTQCVNMLTALLTAFALRALES